MTKIKDIPQMTIQELRPLVQRAMGPEGWPENDRIVISMIFDQCGINVSQAHGSPYVFSAIVIAKGSGEGIGAANNIDPIIASFRAYLIQYSYQVIRKKNAKM